MSTKLSDLNEKELLELFKNTDNSTVSIETTDVTSFIVQFDIKAGNEVVSLKRLKKIYDNWSNVKTGLKAFMSEVEASTGVKRSNYNIRLNIENSKLNLLHLNILKQKEVKQLNKELKQFTNFIQKHDIKSGNELVNIKIIDFIYDKERFQENKKRIDKRIFTKLLKNHFEVTQTTKGEALLLDKSIYNIITKDKMNELLLNWTLYEEKKSQK